MHARPFLVAPDSFKGTLSAVEVAAAIGRGLERAGAAADLCPLADGGEGTLDALAPALGATRITARAHDPLGRPIEAVYGYAARTATAIVETAAASGLDLVAEQERDAWAASTFGTGELIAAAVQAGARTILLAAGGSATTDGGAGALEALAGVGAGGLHGAQLIVLCDVRTPFDQAAATFAPQKGADPQTTNALAARLDDLARHLPRDPRGVPLTGCAGGLSGGLWAALGATLAPGAAWVLDALGIQGRLAKAQAVITGEGRLDAQTAEGKLVAEVARRARAAGVPAYAVVGKNALPPQAVRALGLTRAIEASTPAELERAGATLAAAPTTNADGSLDPGARA